jgi:hypothetical protein
LMVKSLGLIRRLWLRKEYFGCVQFDRIAETIGVRLRERKRYEFRRGSGFKASFRIFLRTIVFGKDWFDSLSPQARCALLAHELWHHHTRWKSTVASILVLFMLFFGWLLLAAAIGFAVESVLSSMYVTVLSSILLFVFFQSYGMTFLFRRLFWPLEFQSDEAAVRFLGVDATREMLGTLRKRNPWFCSTHPPTDVRLERVEEWRKKHPEPLIDYNELEEETPQKIVPL